MSFLSKFFGQSSDVTQKSRSLPQTCLLDASSLLDSGNRGKMPGAAPNPREMFNTLRSIAEFASQEDISMCVFLPGRPLREAPDGGAFKSVKVHYAESQAAINERVLEMIPALAKSKEVLVITADAELDKAACKAGASCMRASTFRKAQEERQDSRPEREPRGGPSRNAGNHHHKRRFAPHTQPVQNQNGNKGAPPQRPDEPAPAEQAGQKPDDAVKNLIDTL